MSDNRHGTIHSSSAHGSVTQWIDKLRDGSDDLVEQALWNRYFQRLVSLAQKRLNSSSRRELDEEDAVLNAMNSFFGRIKKGQFPELKDRNNLWPLLVKITVRKVYNQQRRAFAQKRKGVGESGIDLEQGFPAGMDYCESSEPTPEIVASAVEEVQRLMNSLPQDSLRRVAELKLEGYTNREIAQQLNIIERTVERRLVLIRTRLSEQLAQL